MKFNVEFKIENCLRLRLPKKKCFIFKLRRKLIFKILKFKILIAKGKIVHGM